MQKAAKMAASRIHVGLKLQGHKTFYNIFKQLNEKNHDVWIAQYVGCPFTCFMLILIRDSNAKTVLVKTGPSYRIDNEIGVQTLCRDHRSIRQMIDVIEDPKSLVLEYFDKTLYDACYERQLERKDVKRAIKTALDALTFLHSQGRAHTGKAWRVTPIPSYRSNIPSI